MLITEEFTDRRDELNFLEKKHESDNFECIMIYGRRRVGKTTLIKKFISDKDHIYHLVTQEEKSVQLRRLIDSVHSTIGGVIPRVEDWYDLFDYFNKEVPDNIVMVIDEFPYLIEQDKSVPSLFQAFIDEYLSKKDLMLLLCGSSISMMESMLTHSSPLYGRRTGQIDLKPFGFRESMKMLPDMSIEEQVEFFSVFGGTPFYLQTVDTSITPRENIVRNICDDKEILHEEPWMLLKQEFQKPHRYMSILEAIAAGYNTPKKISDHISIPQQSVPKYLNELERIRLIRHMLPVTERKKRSRRGIYVMSDNYFDFWFKFIAPNMSDVEEDPVSFVRNKVMENINSYVGRKFEQICTEFISISPGLDYSLKGRWWYKEQEIDIVALNEREKKILLAECKWSKNPVDISLLHSLKEKAEKVRWNNEDRTEHYAIFSKSGFTDELVRESSESDNIHLYTLDDLRIFSNR